MVYLICIFVGFAGGLVFCFATDSWRVRTLLKRGYDGAVRDIFEYGIYYNKDNKQVRVAVQTEREDENELKT